MSMCACEALARKTAVITSYLRAGLWGWRSPQATEKLSACAIVARFSSAPKSLTRDGAPWMRELNARINAARVKNAQSSEKLVYYTRCTAAPAARRTATAEAW